MLLEAARLSNSSRFSFLFGFRRRQIQTIHIRNKPKMIVPKLARRIMSFFASSIGISTVVFSVVCSVVVDSVVVASEVEVTSSVWVNSSVDLKKFIFLFLDEMRSTSSLYMTGNDAKEATYAWVGPPGCLAFPPPYNHFPPHSHSK